MPRVQKRKYEKIDDDEIDLVIQCKDSHEFYEKYREAFPTKKKGIDSISKIWKRRGEFIKKYPDPALPSIDSVGASAELEHLIAAQNKLIEEISGTLKEQLKVSREILVRLPKNLPRPEDHSHSGLEHKPTDHKEPAKRSGTEKSNDIMIGS
jgi:uncharacterized coiled-coil protein SlyX